MGRLTSAEYAKSHGAAAGKQLHKERQTRTDAINKLAQRVVNTGKGSQSNRVGSSVHRSGRLSLVNRPTPKFGPGGFTVGPSNKNTTFSRKNKDWQGTEKDWDRLVPRGKYTYDDLQRLEEDQGVPQNYADAVRRRIEGRGRIRDKLPKGKSKFLET